LSFHDLCASASSALNRVVRDPQEEPKRTTPTNIAFKFTPHVGRDIFVRHVSMRDNIVFGLEGVGKAKTSIPQAKTV
jgi:hypothetical protein